MPRKKNSKEVSISANSNSLFKPSKNDNKGQNCVQNVNVQITIPKEESVVVGCFKAFAGLFRKGG